MEAAMRRRQRLDTTTTTAAAAAAETTTTAEQCIEKHTLTPTHKPNEQQKRERGSACERIGGPPLSLSLSLSHSQLTVSSQSAHRQLTAKAAAKASEKRTASGRESLARSSSRASVWRTVQHCIALSLSPSSSAAAAAAACEISPDWCGMLAYGRRRTRRQTGKGPASCGPDARAHAHAQLTARACCCVCEDCAKSWPARKSSLRL